MVEDEEAVVVEVVDVEVEVEVVVEGTLVPHPTPPDTTSPPRS